MFLNSLDWENKVQQANTIASEHATDVAKSIVGQGNSNLANLGISGIGGQGQSVISNVLGMRSPLFGQATSGGGRGGSSGLSGFGGLGSMGGGKKVIGTVLSLLGLPIPGSDSSQNNANAMGIRGALAQTGAIPDLPPIQGIAGAATGGRPIPIPVIPYENQQGLSNQIPGNVDFTDINKQAQESTKKLYPWWWEEHGPEGTGWFGPGDPRDLTD